MKNYREKIRKLAETAKTNDEQSGYDDLQFISGQLDAIVNYHDRVIKMEQQMDFQKMRLEPEDFREWLSDQNDGRIKTHERMIDAVIILNRYSKNNGLEPFYDGKVDETARYKDPDTRFGIAEMADKYCSEIFRAGQGQTIDRTHSKELNKALALGAKFDTMTNQDEMQMQ